MRRAVTEDVPRALLPQELYLPARRPTVVLAFVLVFAVTGPQFGLFGCFVG